MAIEKLKVNYKAQK